MVAALLAVGCLRERPVFYPPVWSPDGEKLYHVVERPDGRMEVRRTLLTTNDAGELATSRLTAPPAAIAMAPDGSKVACLVLARAGSGTPTLRLHVLSRDAGGDRVVWEQPSQPGIADPCWASDSQSIVLAAASAAGCALWQIPLGRAKPRLLVDDLHAIRAPSLSPDGRRVAFVAQAKARGPWSLYVVSVSNGARRVAATAIFARYRLGYWPAWSPRGDRVAYVAERYLTEGTAEVRAWEPATGRRRLLARAFAGSCLAPAWAPDGTAVAFVRLPFGDGGGGPGSGGRPADIVVVDADGANARPLVADGLANLMPSWSPDGKAIAFNTCADPSAGPHVVRLARLDASAPTLAHENPGPRFLLAFWRSQRGSRAALRAAAAAVATIRDAATRARAHLALAEHAARERSWSLAARHAAAAATTPHRPARVRACRLLATARMRLGEPAAALAAAERCLAETKSSDDKALCERLRGGLRAAGELRGAATAAGLHRLARVHLEQLGAPRAALEHSFRLLNEFPGYARLPEVAGLVFACYEELGADALSHRVLARAAAIIAEAALSPDQLLLLAEAAAAGARPEVALGWLGRIRVGKAAGPVQARMTAVYLAVAEQFRAKGAGAWALDAWRHAERTGPGALAARAALRAGKFLAEHGEHTEATRRLLAALSPNAEAATVRQALRQLTLGRLGRADPPAYDAARVAELVRFGFLDSAAVLGERVADALPKSAPRSGDVRRHLARAFERLVDYHLACGNAGAASRVVARWLDRASPASDLPRALANLARCQRLSGERKGLIETLSRLALEFPGSPEGSEARRQLLLLNRPGRR